MRKSAQCEGDVPRAPHCYLRWSGRIFKAPQIKKHNRLKRLPPPLRLITDKRDKQAQPRTCSVIEVNHQFRVIIPALLRAEILQGARRHVFLFAWHPQELLCYCLWCKCRCPLEIWAFNKRHTWTQNLKEAKVLVAKISDLSPCAHGCAPSTPIMGRVSAFPQRDWGDLTNNRWLIGDLWADIGAFGMWSSPFKD